MDSQIAQSTQGDRPMNKLPVKKLVVKPLVVKTNVKAGR